MKKKFLVLLATLMLIICSLSFIGCKMEPSLEGVYKCRSGDAIYTLYLFKDGEGYFLETYNDEIDERARFEYKILEKDKYVAVTVYDDDVLILEYEQLSEDTIYVLGLNFIKIK